MKKTDVAKKMSKSPLRMTSVELEYQEGRGKGGRKLPNRNGKASLNRAGGRNEGDSMTLGKNENNRF